MTTQLDSSRRCLYNTTTMNCLKNQLGDIVIEENYNVDGYLFDQWIEFSDSTYIVHHYDNQVDVEEHERLNYSYLNDGLWKASRFDMDDCHIKDSLTEDKMLLREHIEMMFDFLSDDLKKLSNEEVIDIGKSILSEGPESSRQLEIYNKSTRKTQKP